MSGKINLLFLFLACNSSLLCALSDEIIFKEDFQSYPPNHSPFENNWKMPYSGAGEDKQVVLQENENKYLHLEGASYWSVNAVKDLQKTPQQVYLEVEMRCNNLLGAGNDLNELAAVGFYSQQAAPWGYIFAGILFDWKGNIVFGQLNAPEITNKIVGKWKPKQWYKIKIFYNAQKSTASLWIDGKLLCEDFALPQKEKRYNTIVLKGGNGAKRTLCDYDNIAVYSSIEPLLLSEKTLQGENLYKEKKYQQALKIFAEIYQTSPENIHNLGNLSIAYLKNGNLEKCREMAFKIIKNATAEPKEKASAYYNIGLSYQGNDMDQAYYYQKSFSLHNLPFLREKLNSLPNLIFYENFDLYSTDNSIWEQSEWELTFPGKGETLQKLDSDAFISSDYSLQLVADTISPACAHRFLDFAHHPTVSMSIWIKTKNLTKSNKEGEETQFGFYDPSLEKYGYFFAGIKFKNDHFIYFGSSAENMENIKLISWKPETWYKIEFQYNITQGIGNVKINDQIKAELVTLNNSYPPTANSVCLFGGNNTENISNFDNLTIYTKSWEVNLLNKN